MNEKKLMGQIFDTLLDFIYPRNIYCILCGTSIEKTEKYSMCTPCREGVSFITSRFCAKCGKPLESMYLPQKCPDCIQNGHYFDKGFSCVAYDDKIKKLIYDLKYHGKRYLAYSMAEIMTERLEHLNLGKIDVIVSVPLHKKRERERGFNQSELLGHYIGKAFGIFVSRKGLLRIKATDTQNKLSREERKKNLKEAFFLSDSSQFYDKVILIVDDIYTTGSTIDACAKELQKAKPKEIYFMTFATGRNV